MLQLATVTDSYLSLNDQEVTAGTVPVSLGGTGATTAAAARTALDVDQAGTDNKLRMLQDLLQLIIITMVMTNGYYANGKVDSSLM